VGNKFRSIREMSLLPKPFMISKAGIGTTVQGPDQFDIKKVGSSSLMSLAISASYWYQHPL